MLLLLLLLVAVRTISCLCRIVGTIVIVLLLFVCGSNNPKLLLVASLVELDDQTFQKFREKSDREEPSVAILGESTIYDTLQNIDCFCDIDKSQKTYLTKIVGSWQE